MKRLSDIIRTFPTSNPNITNNNFAYVVVSGSTDDFSEAPITNKSN